jgi:SAM-dependent methyltransferase
MGPEQFDLHSVLESTHWWFTGRRKIVRDIVAQLLPPSGGGRVVDVGCGTGANLAALASDYTCEGIDPSDQAVAYARQRYPEIQFRCGTAPADLGTAADEADLFLLLDVLEHVADDRALLAALIGAARPGAYLLITVPADMTLWSAHDVAFGHYRRYDRVQFEQVWAGLPVTVRLLSHFNTRLYPVVRAVRTFNRWKGTASGVSGTDLSPVPVRINRALHALFAGESARLISCLGPRRGRGYDYGVSLMAVLHREDGEVSV